MPKLSVIVPCYNAERYIPDCLESIGRQTVGSYEIVFINDGSRDGTADILDGIAAVRPDVKVVHKPNGGVSSARNAGLDVASGEWITFVDVDDKIKPDAFEHMLGVAAADDDAVFAGFEIYHNGILSNRIPPYKCRSLDNIAMAAELFAPSDYTYQGFICSKLYRRDIIEKNKIRFVEGIKYNEDRLFTFTYLAYAGKGTYTTKPVYEYYLHGANAMAAVEGPGFTNFESDLDAFVEMSRIAPLYNSQMIVNLVRRGTLVSYRWNRRLNRQYGANCAETNRRLRKKLFSVAPKSFLIRFRLAELKGAMFSRIKNILR